MRKTKATQEEGADSEQPSKTALVRLLRLKPLAPPKEERGLQGRAPPPRALKRTQGNGKCRSGSEAWRRDRRHKWERLPAGVLGEGGRAQEQECCRHGGFRRVREAGVVRGTRNFPDSQAASSDGGAHTGLHTVDIPRGRGSDLAEHWA